MRVFALSDLHLALGTPGKTMDRFGPQWVDHPRRMAEAWDERVASDDLVLVPGDVSWASTPEQVAPDLAWLAERPGTKVLIQGNHEHWWASLRRVRALLPEGVVALEADAARFGDVAVCGTRLWDAPGGPGGWHDLILWQGDPISPESTPEQAARDAKIYRRELMRLDRALDALDATAPVRIVMLHYPPSGPDLAPNAVTERLERAGVDHVVYGHLHAIDPDRRHEIAGAARGVRYHLASCDVVDFRPTLVRGAEPVGADPDDR